MADMQEFIIKHIEPVAELWDQDTPTDEFARAIIASARIFFECVGQIDDFDDDTNRVIPVVNEIVLDYNKNLGATMQKLTDLGKIRNAGSG